MAAPPRDASSTSARLNQTKRRGFSLVESAIVLGVVGLIVGTIWVAARAVSQNLKAANAAEIIFQAAKNIQNLISRRDAEAMNIADPAVDRNITSFVTSSGVMPKNAGDVLGPYAVFIGCSGAGFEIGFPIKDKAFCIKLITRLSSSAAMASRYATSETGYCAKSTLRTC